MKKLVAELVGTFWLVFCVCGAALLAAGFPEVGIGHLGVALAVGLAVMTMAYAVGPVSGGHFNPAVSVGMVIGGETAGLGASRLHSGPGVRRCAGCRCDLLHRLRGSGVSGR